MLAQLMAVHRQRLFVIEAGNSFGLLADWFESLGLSVNRVALKPGSGVSLPTFADAALLAEAGEVNRDTETRRTRSSPRSATSPTTTRTSRATSSASSRPWRR